jgi:sugar-specific transcriptional regulator TrmB
MENKDVLKELGLSDGEATVYLALLKSGSTTVSKLTKETKQHRTTIYDFLEHLLKKGLVSYVLKSGVKYFKVADPDKLFEYIKEKEDNLNKILPELHKLADIDKEELSVEVYQGLEGFKNILDDVIKVKKNFYSFGIDEAYFEKNYPIQTKNLFLREKEAEIKEFILTSDKAKFVYNQKHLTYRYIPEKYFNPTPTGVYGDRVVFVIWSPMTAILIKNKQLADAYLKHHQLLWSIAKEKVR